jgi:hypothetical protein
MILCDFDDLYVVQLLNACFEDFNAYHDSDGDAPALRGDAESRDNKSTTVESIQPPTASLMLPHSTISVLLPVFLIQHSA